MSKKVLILWNIILTALLAGMLFNGCDSLPVSDTELLTEVRNNKASIKQNTELNIKLQESNLQLQESIIQLQVEVATNRETISALETALEKYVEDYIDWYMKEDGKAVVEEIVKQMP